MFTNNIYTKVIWSNEGWTSSSVRGWFVEQPWYIWTSQGMGDAKNSDFLYAWEFYGSSPLDFEISIKMHVPQQVCMWSRCLLVCFLSWMIIGDQYFESKMGIEVDSAPFEVSLLSFALERPCDGYPILEEWATLAQDIFHGGWENHRAPLEIRLTVKVKTGEPVVFASLLPSKGFSRLSVLLFGLLWTYTKLEPLGMSEEKAKDFARWACLRIKRVVLFNPQQKSC